MNGNDQRGKEGVPPDPGHALIMEQADWVLGTWKRAAEAKDWAGLADLIGLPEFFVSGEPHETPEMVQTVTAAAHDLFDLEIVYRDITPRTITAERVYISFSARILWTTADTFEEQNMDIAGHAGFAVSRESWTPIYLLLDQSPPDRVAERRGRDEAAPAAEPASARDAAAPFSDADIAAAAASYFAPVEPSPTAAPGAPQRKKHIVYMPVIIDAELMRDLLS